MKIETKFDIGQKVWFLIDNKPKVDTIEHIRIFIDKRFNVHKYFLSDLKDYLGESHLFESEEKLLEKNNITLIKIAAN